MIPFPDLRDARDALVVFEAVRIGVLPLIKRRLTSDERDQLSSGNVFVWEEAEHKGGLERWTDGRRWGPSRVRDVSTPQGCHWGAPTEPHVCTIGISLLSRKAARV